MLKKRYLLWHKPLPESTILQLDRYQKVAVFKSLLDLFKSVFEVDPSTQYVYRVLYSSGDDGTNVYIRRRVSPRNLLLAFYRDGWKTNTGIYVKSGEGFINTQALLIYKEDIKFLPLIYMGNMSSYDTYNTVLALSNKHTLLLKKYLEEHDWHLARALLAYSRNKAKVQATTSSSDKGRILNSDVSLTKFMIGVAGHANAKDDNTILNNYLKYNYNLSIAAFSDELFPYRDGNTIAISNKAYSKAKTMFSDSFITYIDSVLVKDKEEAV